MSLEELQLALPKIELNETRFLLGGTGYDVDGSNNPIPHTDPISQNEPVGPIDLNPNGPEDVGDDGVPTDEINPDPIGGEETDQQNDDSSGDHDEEGYGDNGYTDQDNYGDNDPVDGNGQDNVPPPGGGATNWYNNGPGATGYVGLPSSLSDGINPDNIDWNISDDLYNNSEVLNFTDQLNEILGSNSIVATLIQQIRANGADVTFSVADLPDTNGDVSASTNPGSPIHGNNTITFDLSNINSNGWINTSNPNGANSTNNYATTQESLLNTLVHELNHVLINSMVTSAYQHLASNGNPTGSSSPLYDTMVSLHGEDVANIFYTYNSSSGIHVAISDPNVIETNHHNYMYNSSSDYNQYLVSALQEWISDLEDFERYLEEADRDGGLGSQGGGGNDPNGDGRG